MDLLNHKIKNLTKLKSYIATYTTKELTELSKPCYYPKTKKVYFELLNLVGVEDKDVKSFVKLMYEGTKAERWKLWKDPSSNLLLIIMYQFLKNLDVKSYQTTLLMYLVIHYSRLIHKHIRFCYPETFEYALSLLSRSHLFVREGSISNALMFLSSELDRKYRKAIRNWDIDQIILFVSVSRHRIAQSVRSLASAYYKARKEGSKIITHKEPTEDEELQPTELRKRGDYFIDKVVLSLTTYKTIDKEAFGEARRLSNIPTSVATIVCNTLADISYSENLKLVFLTILRTMDIKDFCSKKFITKIRRACAQKKAALNEQISIVANKILKANKHLRNYGEKRRKELELFLCFYLFFTFRNKTCP